MPDAMSQDAGAFLPNPPIRAVVFDLDGTLLDTEGLSDVAILGALGESLPPAARGRIRAEHGVAVAHAW